jgi:hypothetical protein
MAGTFPATGHAVDYPPGNGAGPLAELFGCPYRILKLPRQSDVRADPPSARLIVTGSDEPVTHIPAVVGPASFAGPAQLVLGLSLRRLVEVGVGLRRCWRQLTQT